MMSILDQYLDIVSLYKKFQITLTSVLAHHVRLKPAKPSHYHFTPTETSIVEQIKHWPEKIPILPLPLWVDPQQGSIIWKETQWNFFFHGSQGLTFRNTFNDQEVGVEYSTTGELGITKWTVKMYLESTNNSELRQLIHQNDKLFDEAVQKGYLVKLPTKILFIEEVFVLRS